MANPEQKFGVEAFLIRHSKASLQTYETILMSDDPQQPVTKDFQVSPDLKEEGKKMAEEKAEALFEKMDPEKDELVFVSSQEARALETAAIYRNIAKQQGFTILSSGKTGSELAQQLGEGDIRIIKALMPEIKNTLMITIFFPKNKVPEINWTAVPTDIKKKWDQARSIVENNDHGSYSANLTEHIEAVRQIFPEMASADERNEKILKKLKRLFDFAQSKAKENPPDKNIKILAFGHDTYMSALSEKVLKDSKTENCQAINIQASSDGEYIITKDDKSKNTSL